MSWKQPLIAFAASLNRAVFDHPCGLGIEFEDGFDAFWILPGEATSTVPVPADAAIDPAPILAAYDAINHLRGRAMHVLGHHLADMHIAADRRRNGEWGIEFEGGASTSLCVGGHLTAVARDTGDLHETILTCLKNSWIKPPSAKRIDRYLNTSGPPANERSIDDDAEPQPSERWGIRQTLGLMGLCKALENPENFTSPQRLSAAVEPTGRIGQALVRLAERLPNVSAGMDLMRPGTICLAFDDGEADFDIDTRSRSLAERISVRGPEAAGDKLADDYLRLNAGRSAVLRAIRQAAAQRGWRQETFGLALLGIEKITHLGETRREVSFHGGDELTHLVDRFPPEGVIRKLLAHAPEFAEGCVAALRDPLPEDEIHLPEGALRPRDVPPAPALRELDAALIAELDRFADRTLRDYLEDRRTVGKYNERDVYDPAVDTWAQPGDWVRLAERHLGQEWVDTTAIVILLDAGDVRGDQAARAFLARAEPDPDFGPSEVEIVWRYRHELPDVARKWFKPQPYDDVPFAQERAALGDPVALRHVSVDAAAIEDVDHDPAAVKRLSSPRQEQVHRELLAWARTDHHWSGPNGNRLRAALEMGWRDVAEALPENPYMLAGLLTIERRSDQLDEPGLLLASEFLLVWSRLSPSRFLAQLIVTGRTTDMVALAQEAARRSAEGKPDLQANLEMTAGIYAAWMKELHPALAIAWKRCRGAGVDADEDEA